MRIRAEKAGYLAVIAVFLAAGCAGVTGKLPQDPQARLALAADSYTLTLQTATDLYRTGYLDREDMEAVAASAHVARRALDAWRLALKEDRDPEAARQRFDEALTRMQTVLDEREGNSDGRPGDHFGSASDGEGGPADPGTVGG